MYLRLFYWLWVFSWAIALMRERLFCRDIVGLIFFSLKERILCCYNGLLSDIFAWRNSSSSASFRVKVLGDPLVSEKRLSVMNS